MKQQISIYGVIDLSFERCNGNNSMAMVNTLISQIYKNTNRYTTILWKYTISVLVQTYSLHKEDEITGSLITLFTVLTVRILMYNDKNCGSQSR